MTGELWDAFPPVAYHDEHYGRLRDDDAQILRHVADWLAPPASRRAPAALTLVRAPTCTRPWRCCRTSIG